MINLEHTYPGCDKELTIKNVGGYHCYCNKCIDAIPGDGNNFKIAGKYNDKS